MGNKLGEPALHKQYTQIYKKKYYPKLIDKNSTIPERDKSHIKNLLTKPWNPYIQRHSALTSKSIVLKEHVLRDYAGWAMNSKMPQIYIHYYGNESSKSLLEAYGIEDNSKKGQTNILKSKLCPNCEEPNRPDSRFCFKCKMVLTFDSYKETLDKEKEKDDEIANMKQVMKQVMDGVDNLKKDFINKKSFVMSAETYNNVHKMMDQMKKEYKININKLLESQNKLLQKRAELFAKKGFVTKEDEEVINKSVLEEIK